MNNDIKTIEKHIDWALKSIMVILDELNLNYMIVYVTFLAILAAVLLTLLQASTFTRRQEYPVVVDPLEISRKVAKKPNKGLTFTQLKTSILLDHVKCLRELHVAAERCYIKKNELKCIQLTTYCPYMINVRSPIDGYTPFHKVCYHGCTVLIKFMLSKGANLSLKTYEQESPLGLAIQACIKNPTASLECVQCFQEYGYVLTPTDKWYQIYLQAALLTRNQSLAEWLFNQAPPLGDRSASWTAARI